MNKKMRELLSLIEKKRNEAKGFMEGETKDVEKASKILDECEKLQAEYEVEKKLYEAEISNASEAAPKQTEKANGFTAITKAIFHGNLTPAEKALFTGGSSGEDNLVPEDVRLEINELRKSYVSAKDLVTVIPTTSLSGSINYESGTPAGLIDFTDGGDLTEAVNPSFAVKRFAIKWLGNIIPISNILRGAEKAGLMAYLNNWFIKNAILSENKKIFDTLKNGKTVKAIKGWKALKRSINADLDPSALIDGVIVTNQTGFVILDEEEDKDGKPILQPNPMNPTEKLFQGLPVKVFPDAQLPAVSGKAPIIYGSVKAGATFVEYQNLIFDQSEHAYFAKNALALRVMEGIDVIGTDNADSTYIYGTFEATPTTTA